MKIAFFDSKPYDKIYFDIFAKKHKITIKYFETKLNEDTVNLAKGYDAVCVFVNDVINSIVIDALINLNVKIISLRSSGFNNIDLKQANGKIHVFRVPSYSPHAVAEHTMALLLSSVRNIHKSYIRTREFNFSLANLLGFDLYQKNIGVIGTGKIGQIFIKLCRGFDMNVYAFDKFKNEEFAKKHDVEYTDLDTLFAKSDIISLHCPLTEETKHIINKDTIEKCKEGVIILNTSRGGLIDTEELIFGIKNRKIGAACLDVYEEEADFFFEDLSADIVKDDTLTRLISLPNVIVTSHQAFFTKEALSNIAKTTIENIITFKEKGYCENELFYKDKI